MRVPKIPITDNRFNYVPSAKTDIRDTFRRAREQLQREKEPTLQSGSFVLPVEWFQLLE
jgi:hypothetical protein